MSEDDATSGQHEDPKAAPPQRADPELAMRIVLFLLTLTACHAPAPRDYCAFTCARADMSWRGEATMPDPNDPTRIRWCVCTSGRRYTALPPRDPRR